MNSKTLKNCELGFYDKFEFFIRILKPLTDDLLLLQISSCVVWQIRDLHLPRNKLYLLSPFLCFVIVLKRVLFVYRDDSLTS